MKVPRDNKDTMISLKIDLNDPKLKIANFNEILVNLFTTKLNTIGINTQIKSSDLLKPLKKISKCFINHINHYYYYTSLYDYKF
jgi:hypothetical protein